MNPRLSAPIAFAAAVALVACKSSRQEADPIAGGDPGAMVRLAGGNMSIGFAQGRLKASVTLGAFSISRTPVTVQEFNACVASGACRWSDASCRNPEGEAGDVALCVGFDAAAAYCGWVGGRLPTFPEWLLAARGPAARRFPWGETAATCEQHPRARRPHGVLPSREEAEYEREHGFCGVEATNLVRTGEHPAGASAAGLEDILLSEGELVRGSSDSPISVCTSQDGGCVVFGLLPGAIDAAEGVAPSASLEPGVPVRVSHPYGFRCAKSGEVL